MVRLYLGFCQLITMTPAQGVGCILLCSLLLWSGCDHESTAVRFTSSHESDAITTKATLVSDDDAENFALISELKQLTIEDQQGANNLRSMSESVEKLCTNLYDLRMDCPLLSPIVSQFAPLVTCTDKKPEVRSFVSAQFSQELPQGLELIFETAGGETLKFDLTGGGRDRFDVGMLIKDAATDGRNSNQLIKDIKMIRLQKASGGDIDLEDDVRLSIIVNGKEIIANEDRGYAYMTPHSEDGRVKSYSLNIMANPQFMSLREKSECIPDHELLTAERARELTAP